MGVWRLRILLGLPFFFGIHRFQHVSTLDLIVTNGSWELLRDPLRPGYVDASGYPHLLHCKTIITKREKTWIRPDLPWKPITSDKKMHWGLHSKWWLPRHQDEWLSLGHRCWHTIIFLPFVRHLDVNLLSMAVVLHGELKQHDTWLKWISRWEAFSGSITFILLTFSTFSSPHGFPIWFLDLPIFFPPKCPRKSLKVPESPWKPQEVPGIPAAHACLGRLRGSSRSPGRSGSLGRLDAWHDFMGMCLICVCFFNGTKISEIRFYEMFMVTCMVMRMVNLWTLSFVFVEIDWI